MSATPGRPEPRRSPTAPEGLLLVLGVTLGIIPLAQVLTGGRPGLWDTVLVHGPQQLAILVPVAVILSTAAAILRIERRKRTTPPP